ncbi:hypothetical protein [Actinotignum sp. GS-2025c]|uniref:hypothetical protein n=1 Tax=Actinotignum sp. GS-2025c TaxID=3427276 RepID=UPI003F481742
MKDFAAPSLMIEDLFDAFQTKLDASPFRKISVWYWWFVAYGVVKFILFIGALAAFTCCVNEADSYIKEASDGANVNPLMRIYCIAAISILVLSSLSLLLSEYAFSRSKKVAHKTLVEIFTHRNSFPDFDSIQLMRESAAVLGSSWSRTFRSSAWKTPGFLLALLTALLAGLFAGIFAKSGSTSPLAFGEFIGNLVILYLTVFYAPQVMFKSYGMRVRLFEHALLNVQIGIGVNGRWDNGSQPQENTGLKRLFEQLGVKGKCLIGAPKARAVNMD